MNMSVHPITKEGKDTTTLRSVPVSTPVGVMTTPHTTSDPPPYVICQEEITE